MSLLQVLAILSFEKKNHGSLKDAAFLDALRDAGLFGAIFAHFDKLLQEEKNRMEAPD